MPTGKQVFVKASGVQYLIDRYLTQKDIDDLRKMNTEHSKDRFREELKRRLEKGSGSRNWIPQNYDDELANNAGAIIGTNKRTEKLKNGHKVDVYETSDGKEVYEDKRGRLRDYKTGKYTRNSIFDE